MGLHTSGALNLRAGKAERSFSMARARVTTYLDEHKERHKQEPTRVLEIENLDMYILPLCKVHCHSSTVVQISLSHIYTTQVAHAHLSCTCTPPVLFQRTFLRTMYIRPFLQNRVCVWLSFPEKPFLQWLITAVYDYYRAHRMSVGLHLLLGPNVADIRITRS